MENQEEAKILVFYVDVRNVSEVAIPDIVRGIQDEIENSPVLKNFKTAAIVIPILGNTRIECINPQYIVESNLISKHQIMMKDLHEHLEYQIQQLKDIKTNNEKTITHFDEVKNEDRTDEQNG